MTVRGYTILVFNQPPRPTQPGHPFVYRRNEDWRWSRPPLGKKRRVLLERHVLQQPPPGLNFTDQFAFRPTGSTVAALIALIHTVLKKLSTNHYVHVFTLDFSKAFDNVRHAAVMEKLAQLRSTLPDPVYNWIADSKTLALHKVCRGSVRISRYLCKRHPRLRSWTCSFSGNSSRPTTYSRKQ